MLLLGVHCRRAEELLEADGWHLREQLEYFGEEVHEIILGNTSVHILLLLLPLKQPLKDNPIALVQVVDHVYYLLVLRLIEVAERCLRGVQLGQDELEAEELARAAVGQRHLELATDLKHIELRAGVVELDTDNRALAGGVARQEVFDVIRYVLQLILLFRVVRRRYHLGDVLRRHHS